MSDVSWELLLFGFAYNMAIIVGAILGAHLTHLFLIRRAGFASSVLSVRFLGSYVLLIFGYGVLFSAMYYAYGVALVAAYTPTPTIAFLIVPWFLIAALFLFLGRFLIRRALSQIQPTNAGRVGT